MAWERDRCRGAEIFKKLKSHYRMDQIPSANPNIVKCLIWVAILALMCSRGILRLVRNANPENANRYTHEVELFIRSKMSTEDWEEAARYVYNQDWKRLIEINERSKAMLEKKCQTRKFTVFGMRDYDPILVAMVHVPVGRAKNIRTVAAGRLNNFVYLPSG